MGARDGGGREGRLWMGGGGRERRWGSGEARGGAQGEKEGKGGGEAASKKQKTINEWPVCINKQRLSKITAIATTTVLYYCTTYSRIFRLCSN